MMRLSVVVLERDERKVLRELGRLGAVHLVRLGPGPDTAPLAAHDRTAELTHCDNLLNRIESLRQRLELGALPESALEPVDLPLGSAEGSLRPLEERVSAAVGRQEDLRRRLAEASATWRQAGPFRELDVPLDLLGGSAFLHFAIGTLPAENLPPLRARVGPNVVLAPLAEHEGRRPLIAITSLSSREPLEAALKDLGFTRETLCAEEGASAKSLADESRSEREFLRGQVEDARTQVAALGREVAQPLADLKRLLAMERALWEAEQHFPRTEQTSLITGWVPAPDVPEVERSLGQIPDGRYVLAVADPGDVPEDEIPVLLRHSWLIRPFVALNNMYGLPTYYEVEPTFFVAISYVLMFGMMFGDAGNGLVVALLGAGLIWKGRTLNLRDAGLVLLLAGISGMGFGIYYGSYFGIEEMGGHPLGRSPLGENTLNLMITAIALGVALMSLGLVLGIINRLRHGDVMGALMDKFGVAGVVFYWGCLALLGYVTLQHGASVPWWVAAGVIVLPLLAVAAREPLHLIRMRRQSHASGYTAPMGETLIVSAVEAFETVLGYVANTISFVRLAAFAIAHAAVLLASFAIAHELQKGLGPVVGGVLGVLVIIIGNAVAIALEGLVAFVQALRLEFYEFFCKFFSGAGRPFKPFRLSGEGKGVSVQG